MSYINLGWYVAAAILDPKATEIPQGDLSNDTVKNAINIALGIAGGIAVLLITLSAFRYIVSQGDPQATAKAKNGIINALIGLVICLLAVAIVSFVTSKL